MGSLPTKQEAVISYMVGPFPTLEYRAVVHKLHIACCADIPHSDYCTVSGIYCVLSAIGNGA